MAIAQEARQVSEMQAAPSEAPAAEATPAKKPSIARFVVGGVLLVGLAGGFTYYRHGLAHEETDDAQIDGDVSSVSPRVAGTIKNVFVKENQIVNVGDPLVELDPADYEVAVALAKAQVAQAEAQLNADVPAVAMTETTNVTSIATSGSDIANAHADLAGAEAALGQAEAQLAQMKANQKLAEIELDREQKLAASGSTSGAQIDAKTAAAEAARAATSAAEESKRAAKDRIAQARARLSTSVSRAGEVKENAPRQVASRQATVDWRRANLDAAKAQLQQAELNLKYTKILSVVSGIVGRKSVSLGDRVQPGQQLMAVTQVDHVWVTANFRETQLREMRVGQPVKVHVDALGRDFTGSVESVSGATGSRYSLLPPENASGNYVKVVQRIPVRIKLDPGQPDLDRLRPGMSVEPDVQVR
jgi:membrane fusion protein (multidrug efflux system)